jgi:hypothetical protein
MADRKISDLTALTTPASGDYLPIVDISEAAAASKNKRITIEELMRGVPDGTAAAPGIAFETDPNTGIYRPGADQLAVATNGTERLRIASSGGATFKGGSIFIEATSDTNNAQISLGRPSSSSAGYIRYINSENALAFRTNGSGEDVRIDSSGRLGIGTSAPAAVLHTVAAASFDPTNVSDFTGVGLFLQSPVGIAGDGNFGSALAWSRPEDNSRFKTAIAPVQEGSDQDRQGLAFFTANSPTATVAPQERLRISNAGNVGIGTTSPGADLEIGAVAGSDRTVNIRSAGGLRGVLATNAASGEFRIGATNDSSSGNLVFQTGAALAERMKIDSNGTTTLTSATSTSPFIVKVSTSEVARIDASGRLLVGTSSSSISTSLVVQGNSAGTASGQMYLQRDDSTPSSGNKLADFNFADSSGNRGASISALCDGTWTAGSFHPGALTFSTTADGASSPTQHLYISSEGYVVPGTSAVADLSGANCGPGLKLVASTNNTGARLEGVAGSASTRYHAAFSNPNGLVGSISTNASATAYNTSSDYRLKENVTAVSDGITRLQQLKPSRFNFIADSDRTVDGFLAHEVQTIVPEAITGEKDAVDDNGNPEYQGIDQSKLVPLLTAALQEAIGEIEALKARVAALEAN